MTLKLCVVCGVPSETSRCPDHQPEQPGKLSRHERGYTNSWARLSARARRLQPWCSDCGTTANLSADHLRWPARSLKDVDVVCVSCNAKRGAARTLKPTGDDPHDALKYPRRKAMFPTVSTFVSRGLS